MKSLEMCLQTVHVQLYIFNEEYQHSIQHQQLSSTSTNKLPISGVEDDKHSLKEGLLHWSGLRHHQQTIDLKFIFMNILALLTLGIFSHLSLNCYVCLYALGKDWARSAGWRGRKGAAERAVGTRLGSTSSSTSLVRCRH